MIMSGMDIYYVALIFARYRQIENGLSFQSSDGRIADRNDGGSKAIKRKIDRG